MRVSLFISFMLLSAAPLIGSDAAVYSTVIGKWVTFDDNTRKASSIIEMTEVDGLVQGKIIKTFHALGEKKLIYCQHCSDDRKNKPILGLTIIRSMRCQQGSCVDGTILDPRDGKVYHATMRLFDDGRQLKVRGYIGIALFGKTVVWARLTDSLNNG